MKRLLMVTYRFKEGLGEQDLRALTKKFMEVGTNPGVLAHYSRLDGQGGFLVEDATEDPAIAYEVTITYSPWLEFEVFPITTMEDAFPVIQRVYG